nr:L-2-hydroxyglutarate oxidase [Patulibacter sp. SYSU D01012]
MRRSPAPNACDVAVVGAGIVGAAVARELLLRRPGLRVALLEREAGVAAHQSGHNSGVVHAGVYYRPRSLKARLAAAGVRELPAFCAAHGVPHARPGKLVVATRPEELPRLDELERRSRANGVPGLERVGPDGIREREPHVRGLAALWSPGTGTVDYAATTRALVADALARGATLTTGRAVTGLTRTSAGVLLRHAGGTTRAARAIVCAGAWADALAPRDAAAAAVDDVRIVPFRGAYRVLRPERAHLVRGLVYPVPDPDLPFLGVHLTRGVDGEVHAGPTALLVGARDAYRLTRVRRRDVGATVRWPGTWRMVRRWWPTAAGEVGRTVSRAAMARELRRLVPELRAGDLVPGPAGVRAQAVARDGGLVDDFVIAGDDRVLHVRNAPSPAATSCLPLAREIVDRALAAANA